MATNFVGLPCPRCRQVLPAGTEQLDNCALCPWCCATLEQLEDGRIRVIAEQEMLSIDEAIRRELQALKRGALERSCPECHGPLVKSRCFVHPHYWICRRCDKYVDAKRVH